jgi:hypothetical protein
VTQNGSKIKEIRWTIKKEIIYERPTTKKTCCNEVSFQDMYFPLPLIICSALLIQALKTDINSEVDMSSRISMMASKSSCPSLKYHLTNSPFTSRIDNSWVGDIWRVRRIRYFLQRRLIEKYLSQA